MSSGKAKGNLGTIVLALNQMVVNQKAGSALPTTRALAKQFQASPVTVNKALLQLRHEGKLITRPGSGTYVADTRLTDSPDTSWQSLSLAPRPQYGERLQTMLAPPRGDALSLSKAYLDTSLQPVELLQSALKRAARRSDIWNMPPLEGLESLRAYFAYDIGGRVKPFDIQIVSGGQAAILTALRALTTAGDTILVESPTYVGAIVAAQSLGLQILAVPTDKDGVRVDYLEEAFQQSSAKVFYCQPLHANPTGVSLAASRRKAVINIAEKAGAFIVEDDYMRGLSFDNTVEPPLMREDEGRVVYLRSITKLTAPSLRIAAIAAKGAVAARIKASRVVDDLFGSLVLQEVALELLTSSGWSRHNKKVRQILAERRDAAVSALGQHLPNLKLTSVPTGGFHLWLELPAGMGDKDFADAALFAGVRLNRGSMYFPSEATGQFVRLSYSAIEADGFEQAVQHMAGIFKS